MKYRIGASLALLSLLFSASASNWRADAATPRSAVSEDVVSAEVEILERRFFPKTYWNDPLDKRLQRLELMIYGATQSGSLPERLDRLKKDVTLRSKTPPSQTPKGTGSTAAKPSATAPGTPSSSAAGGASTQYPVLNTLEWRALKKTFASEPLDARLARLESHLFGQPSTTMPYVDRIDRLKRVMGLGMTSEIPSSSALGPAPKARPRGLGPFGASPSWATPTPFAMPEIGGSFPGLDDEMFGGSPESSKALSEMMRKMREQMSQLHRLGPGSWRYDPQTGTWIEQGSGRRYKGGTLPTTPFRTPSYQKDDAQIPPYLDPNSI